MALIDLFTHESMICCKLEMILFVIYYTQLLYTCAMCRQVMCLLGTLVPKLTIYNYRSIILLNIAKKLKLICVAVNGVPGSFNFRFCSILMVYFLSNFKDDI